MFSRSVKLWLEWWLKRHKSKQLMQHYIFAFGFFLFFLCGKWLFRHTSNNYFVLFSTHTHPAKGSNSSFAIHSPKKLGRSVSKQCPADGVWRIGRGGSPDRVLKTLFTSSESSAGHGLPLQRAPKQCPANGVRRILWGLVSRHGLLDTVKRHMGFESQHHRNIYARLPSDMKYYKNSSLRITFRNYEAISCPLNLWEEGPL